jgi:hypothetical protein
VLPATHAIHERVTVGKTGSMCELRSSRAWGKRWIG